MSKQSIGEIVTTATAYVAHLGGIFFHGAKLSAGIDSIPPITEYIGDFGLIGVPIWHSNFISKKIKDLGRKYNSGFVEKIGHYFPEITAGLTTTYFALGESVLPQILPGTADPKDIPAVLVAGISAYLILRKK